MSFELECPVDFKTIDENKARFTALWVFLQTITFLVVENWLPVGFLLLDFSLRAFEYGKFSPLNKLSDVVINLVNIDPKPIDQAPKVFAAKIGWFFSISIIVALWFEGSDIATILAAVLALFSLLESSIGFCAGCYVYTIFKKILK